MRACVHACVRALNMMILYYTAHRMELQTVYCKFMLTKLLEAKIGKERRNLYALLYVYPC